MQSLIFSKESLSLLDVESFVEDICDRYNIQNTFQGNVIIALTEMIDLLKNIGASGELTFIKDINYFKYQFAIKSVSENLNSIFQITPESLALETNYEKGIFSIMALCDDLIVDEQKGHIALSFKDNNEKIISKHRQEYLQNYLGKTIEELQNNEA